MAHPGKLECLQTGTQGAAPPASMQLQQAPILGLPLQGAQPGCARQQGIPQSVQQQHQALQFFPGPRPQPRPPPYSPLQQQLQPQQPRPQPQQFQQQTAPVAMAAPLLQPGQSPLSRMATPTPAGPGNGGVSPPQVCNEVMSISSKLQ